jgi:hypothetical protein
MNWLELVRSDENNQVNDIGNIVKKRDVPTIGNCVKIVIMYLKILVKLKDIGLSTYIFYLYPVFEYRPYIRSREINDVFGSEMALYELFIIMNCGRSWLYSSP